MTKLVWSQHNLTVRATGPRLVVCKSITIYGRHGGAYGGAYGVAHQVEGAMAPEWRGRTLVRGYRFLPGNRIELRVITGPDGKPTSYGQILVWERVSDTNGRAP